MSSSRGLAALGVVARRVRRRAAETECLFHGVPVVAAERRIHAARDDAGTPAMRDCPAWALAGRYRGEVADGEWIGDRRASEQGVATLPSSGQSRTLRRVASALLAGLLLAVVAVPALAHEAREVAGTEMEVGLIGEPVYVGQESGLELLVSRDGAPVEGLDQTLKAEVVHGSSKLELTLEAIGEVEPGYRAAFIPTAAGKYTFHITGTIDGTSVDETFTSSPTGFEEVREAASGEFPVTLPTIAELADQAKKGADAAALVPVALALGAAGLIVGLVGIGVALAGRHRRDA